MSKIKKLIPIMLLSSIFVNGFKNILAMDDIASSFSSKVYSADEINKLYENSQFSAQNLYNKICEELWGMTKDNNNLNHTERMTIINKAIEIIDEYISKCKVCIAEDPIKFNPCKLNFETTMHAFIVNLERTGEFNSFAKAFILYLLSEHMGDNGLVKVIKYDENKYNGSKYEAVFLFDCQNNEKSRSAEGCEYGPIPSDEKEELWKKILEERNSYDLKEYYLLIPHSESNASAKMFRYIRCLDSKKSLTFFPIFQNIISQSRHDLQSFWPSNIQTDAIDITGKFIEGIM